MCICAYSQEGVRLGFGGFIMCEDMSLVRYCVRECVIVVVGDKKMCVCGGGGVCGCGCVWVCVGVCGWVHVSIGGRSGVR